MPSARIKQVHFSSRFFKMKRSKRKSIPAFETWLFQNKRASALVRQGLEDARRGRLVKPKEDFSRYVLSYK